MARGRLISKSLGSSRKFHRLLDTAGGLGEFCQVLFPLIIANTDDYGRMCGDAFTVKLVVLPSSPRPEGDFEQALESMRSVGLIKRYAVDGQDLLEVVKFDKHQPNLHKKSKIALPGISDEAPENDSTATVLSEAATEVTDTAPDKSDTPPEKSGDSPENPADSRNPRSNLTELNLTELKGRELNGTAASAPESPPLVKTVNRRRPYNGGVLAGSLQSDHLEHAACSKNFAWCVPLKLHLKLANSLKPRYGGDVSEAAEALRKWYPTVWESLPADFTMGDIFRFWQPRFDAEFASKDPAIPKSGKPEPVSTVPDADATKAYLRRMREPA